MKKDPSLDVRLQAAGLLLHFPVYVMESLPEAIPVYLEWLDRLAHDSKGLWDIQTLDRDVAIINRLNELTQNNEYVSVRDKDGKVLQTAGADIVASINRLKDWWATIKDKPVNEWPIMAIDSWVKARRDSISKGESQSSFLTNPSRNMLVQRLTLAAFGPNFVPYQIPENEREQKARELITKTCDWWEKNRNKVTWNPKTSRFEIKKDNN